MACKCPKVLPKMVILNPEIKEVEGFLIKPVPKRARKGIYPANKYEKNNERGD